MDLFGLGFMLCDFEQPHCVRNNDSTLPVYRKPIHTHYGVAEIKIIWFRERKIVIQRNSAAWSFPPGRLAGNKLTDVTILDSVAYIYGVHDAWVRVVYCLERILWRWSQVDLKIPFGLRENIRMKAELIVGLIKIGAFVWSQRQVSALRGDSTMPILAFCFYWFWVLARSVEVLRCSNVINLTGNNQWYPRCSTLNERCIDCIWVHVECNCDYQIPRGNN